MPGEVRIGRQALTVLQRVLAVPVPEEGCALLLGEPGLAQVSSQEGRGNPWRLRRTWPCRNVWQPAGERTRRFAIDPREQLLAQKWARGHGLQVLGSAHSHPGGQPVPSFTDRDFCFAPTLMLILALPPTSASAGGAGWPAEAELGCWWIPDPGPGEWAQPRQLTWRMED
jgi:proteasome lid subunit RPN8/RPN11